MKARFSNYPASENPTLVIFIRRRIRRYSRTETGGAIEVERGPRGGRRQQREEKQKLYKKRGSRWGGEAKAIQETGSRGGEYGDIRERRSKCYTRNGDPEVGQYGDNRKEKQRRGAVRRQWKGVAEAIQETAILMGGSTATLIFPALIRIARSATAAPDQTLT